MANVGQKGWECQTPLPVLESQAGQHVPGETALPPHTSACTHAHPSGVTAALPPSVPCVSLTGQCSGVVNHEQIGHSQREAKGTEGGDAAIKAISTELARQTKAQLIEREWASLLLWHYSVALQSVTGMGHTQGACVLTEYSLRIQDA